MESETEPLDNGVTEIHTLDVGQADAHLVITDEGELILIDANVEDLDEKIDTALSGRKVEQTASEKIPLTFAVTHLHNDHVKGLESLIGDYEIQTATEPSAKRYAVRDPDTGEPEDGVARNVFNDYVANLPKLGVENGGIKQVSSGDKLPIESDIEITVHSPPNTEDSVDVTRASTGADVNLPPERPNENSAVYKVEGEQSALFMGDVQDKSDHYGESWLIQEHDDPENDVDLDADILVLAHHGSNKATSTEFLERVDPEVAVISSGLDNDYTSENEHDAHPHDATLKRLHDQDVDVSWTAGHGTLRTELDSDGACPEPTTDLETTDAADLAALKYYCREHEIDPKTAGVLPPDNFPEETPEWAIDTAPMIADTQEQFIDEGIENAESIEDLRQTLDPTPDAHDQLQETVQADRDEHVTTRKDVKRNREAYFSVVEQERAYEQLPLHTRLRANLSTRFGGIEHPLNNVPSSDDIDGPRKVEEVPKAVRHQPAAELRANGDLVKATATYLREAEDAADTAVDTAETTEGLCRRLRDTPGAHQDFLYAIETQEAHEKNKPEKGLDDLLERTNERERTGEQTHSHDQDMSLGL